MLAIANHFGKWIKFRYQLGVPGAIQALEDFSYEQIKIQLSRVKMELVAEGAQTADEIVNSVHRSADTTQRVLSESGIVKVGR